MLKQKLKTMVLTGATVMVLMSTAAPAAMAAPAYLYDQQPDISGGSYYATEDPWWKCGIFVNRCWPR